MREITEQLPDEALKASANGLLPATLADVSDVVRVMEEASRFKQSQGDDVWGEKPITNEEVTSLLDSGNLYVYKVDGKVAASVKLTDSDARIWGEEEGGDGTAIYIHRLCVGNDFRGQQVSARVIDLVSEQAKSTGKTKLRLDSLYDNRELCEVYENMGFSEVRRFDEPSTAKDRNPDYGVFRRALYEKSIAS